MLNYNMGKTRKKLWSHENMETAIHMVKKGSSVYAASKEMGIPKTTLKRHLNISGPSAQPGPLAILSQKDENQLVAYTKFVANSGRPASPTWIRETATRMVNERGTCHKNIILSPGCFHQFLVRHPELAVRTPSLIDPARSSMSRTSVMDCFYRDVQEFLTIEGLLDQPCRIYNIDESWFSPKDTKLQKVVVDKCNRMPYKVFGGVQEHITFTMCINAIGDFLPPMFTFKSSTPSGSDYHTLGPQNALYTCSDSGHIDSDIYFNYIRHIEPFLHSERPVVIFQDNLGAHETYELVKFCVDKQIHLYNFPSKVSHLIQPLDKVFGPFKMKLEKKKQQAMLLQQKHIAKNKIDTVTRFTMDALDHHIIVSAFEKTGIYPLNRAAITDDLLVGDQVGHVLNSVDNPNGSTPCTDFENIYIPSLSLQVYDENDNEIRSTFDNSTHKCQFTQTDPIKSLPCSQCSQIEVALHPAVAAGVVDIEMASVFLQEGISQSTPKKKTASRDCSKGRCLTHDSEVERLRQKIEQVQNELARKKQKSDEPSLV